MTPARRRALVAAAALLLAALSIFMLERPRSGLEIAISPFSGAVTPKEPESLLMISGAWEGRLRDFGLGLILAWSLGVSFPLFDAGGGLT